VISNVFSFIREKAQKHKVVIFIFIIIVAVFLILFLIFSVLDGGVTEENYDDHEEAGDMGVEISLVEDYVPKIEDIVRSGLGEFLAQDADESVADRAKRLEPFIANNSPAYDQDLIVLNTWSRMYALIIKSTVEVGDLVEWSYVREDEATTYVNTVLSFTDKDGFEEDVPRNYFVTVRKIDEQWKIWDIEAWGIL